MDGSVEREEDTDQFREWAAWVGWKLAARCGQAAGGSGRTFPPHTLSEGRTDVWSGGVGGAILGSTLNAGGEKAAPVIRRGWM